MVRGGMGIFPIQRVERRAKGSLNPLRTREKSRRSTVLEKREPEPRKNTMASGTSSEPKNRKRKQVIYPSTREGPVLNTTKGGVPEFEGAGKEKLQGLR